MKVRESSRGSSSGSSSARASGPQFVMRMRQRMYGRRLFLVRAAGGTERMGGGGAGWMSEGARRKFIGGEWRWVGAVAEEEGVVGGRCGGGGRGGRGGGILRTPRISR